MTSDQQLLEVRNHSFHRTRNPATLAGADTFRVRFAPGAESARYNGSIQAMTMIPYRRCAPRPGNEPSACGPAIPPPTSNILPPGSMWRSTMDRSRQSLHRSTAAIRQVSHRGLHDARRCPPRRSGGLPAVRRHSGEEQNSPSDDFADGNAGGPDFWVVSGVSSNDRLNIRTRPSACRCRGPRPERHRHAQSGLRAQQWLALVQGLGSRRLVAARLGQWPLPPGILTPRGWHEAPAITAIDHAPRETRHEDCIGDVHRALRHPVHSGIC